MFDLSTIRAIVLVAIVVTLAALGARACMEPRQVAIWAPDGSSFKP